MGIETLDKTLTALQDEYQKSGIGIDEFIEKKLKESGRQDAKKCVADIQSTLNIIDEKFADLQKKKQDGGNRNLWLLEQLNGFAQKIGTSDMGKIVSSTIKVLKGEKDDTPDAEADFSGPDAGEAVNKLEAALICNTCAGLGAGEE